MSFGCRIEPIGIEISMTNDLFIPGFFCGFWCLFCVCMGSLFFFGFAGVILFPDVLLV